MQVSIAVLLNLTKTYKDDRMFVAQLETLMGTLDTKAKNLQRRLGKSNKITTLKESGYQERSHDRKKPEETEFT